MMILNLIKFISNSCNKSSINNLIRTLKMKILKIGKIYNNYINKYTMFKKD